jgi:DNA-binding IclR family transcriptional regulator
MPGPDAGRRGQKVGPLTDEDDAHAHVRSVMRTVDLLFALGGGPKPLRTISAEVKLSKPTTYRILSSLKSKGMVMQDSQSGDYGLGPACFRLISSVLSGDVGFALQGRPVLETLRNRTGETITIHVRAGLSRICVQELPSPQPLRYTAGLGATVGIYVGSAGKTLLAFMPDDERERILKSLRLAPETANTITSLDVLRAELDEVKEQGFAVSHGERVDGAVGVSAPVHDASGRILAALSILGPADRLTDRLSEMQQLVVAAGKAITENIRESMSGS